jgi:hypothetical protein
MPYGSGVFAGFAFLRCARALGHEGDALTAIAGGTLRRVLEGENAPDVGPAPGTARLGPRDLGFERAMSYLATACQMAFRGADPTEPLSLAALACERLDGDAVAREIIGLVEVSLDTLAAGPPRMTHAMFGALAGQLLAGTAAAGL